MRSGDLGRRCDYTKPTWFPGSEHGIIPFSRLTCRGRGTSQGEAEVFCACSAGRRRWTLPVRGGMCLPKTAAQVRSPGSAAGNKGSLGSDKCLAHWGTPALTAQQAQPWRSCPFPWPPLSSPPVLGPLPSRLSAGQAGEGPTRFGNQKDARGAGHRE